MEISAGHFDVFISYSRADKEHAVAINSFLESKGKSPWLDQDDIHKGVEFMQEIYAGIERSENFVFLISPASVQSEICIQEIEHAIAHKKRIIPILLKETPTEEVHPTLAAINWIILEQQLGQVCEELFEVLNIDVDYIKQHNDMLNASLVWERSNESNANLLRGERLQNAEEWLAEAGDHSPPPTSLQAHFIQASRKGAARRQRQLMFGISIALVISIGLGVYALFERNRAVEQRELAEMRADIAQSRQLAFQSVKLQESKPDVSMLLGLEAHEKHPTTDAMVGLYSNVPKLNLIDRLLPNINAQQLFFSDDGKYLVAKSASEVVVYDATSYEQLGQLKHGSKAFVVESKGVLLLQQDRSIECYRIPSLDLLQALELGGPVSGMKISNDGSKILASTSDSIWVFPRGKDGKYTIQAGIVPMNSSGQRASFQKLQWMAFSSDNTFVSSDGTFLYAWDEQTGILESSRLIGEKEERSFIASQLAFDNQFLIYQLDAMQMKVVNVDDSALPVRVSPSESWTPFNEYRYAFHPSTGQFVDASQQGKVTLKRPNTAITFELSIFENSAIGDVNFNPIGDKVAVLYSNGQSVVLNIPFPQPNGPRTVEMRLAENGAKLMTASYEGNVEIRDRATGKIVQTYEVGEGLTYYSEEDQVLTVKHFGDRGEIVRHHLDGSTERRNFSGVESTKHNQVSHSGHFFLTVTTTAEGKEEGKLYDLRKDSLIWQFTADEIAHPLFDQTEQKVAYLLRGSTNQFVVFDLNGLTVDTLEAHAQQARSAILHRIAFSKSTDQLTLITDEATVVYSLGMGQSMQEYEAPVSPPLFLLFDQDAQFMIGVLKMGQIIIWDCKTGQLMGEPMMITPAPIVDIQLDTTSQTLHVVDNNYFLAALPLNIDVLRDTICSKIHRNLTPEEWKVFFEDEEYRKTCKH